MNARTLLFFSLLLALPSATRAQIDGTLFTSPELRTYLDAVREQYLARSRNRGFDVRDLAIPTLPQEQAANAPRADRIYRLGGIMSLRDGSHSIWLDGRSLREDELPQSARLVREDGTLALRFETPRGVALLRPGQTLNFDQGLIQESYQALGSTDPQAATETEAAPGAAAASESDDGQD